MCVVANCQLLVMLRVLGLMSLFDTTASNYMVVQWPAVSRYRYNVNNWAIRYVGWCNANSGDWQLYWCNANSGDWQLYWCNVKGWGLAAILVQCKRLGTGSYTGAM